MENKILFNNKLPLFKSCYSIGKSILTLDYRDKEARNPENSDSIIEIIEEEGIKNAFLVDDHIGGILEASKNAKKAKVDLRYGLRLSIVEKMSEKNDQTKRAVWKGIVFLKDKEGYNNLIKISSAASTDGFYYEPRIDLEIMASLWDDNLLGFGVPFYDSFIHKNAFHFGAFFPVFSFTKPFFFVEDNELIFDEALKNKVINYCHSNKYEYCAAQSIYYKRKKDYKAYLTARCIYERTSIGKPNLDQMTSNTFCVENL